MLYILQLLLLAMVLTTVTALFSGQGAIFVLLLGLSALSAYAFILWKQYLHSGRRPVYDEKIKKVRTFTIAAAFISFYWPYDMYCNFVLGCCFVFHIILNRLEKKVS